MFCLIQVCLGYLRALGHTNSPWWGMQVPRYQPTDCLPCLSNQALIEILDTKARVSFLAWQYSVCILLYIGLGAVSPTCDSTGRASSFTQASSLDSDPMSLLMVDSNLSIFAIINPNQNYNSFYWVLWILLANDQTCAYLGSPRFPTGVRSKGSLGEFPTSAVVFSGKLLHSIET